MQPHRRQRSPAQLHWSRSCTDRRCRLRAVGLLAFVPLLIGCTASAPARPPASCIPECQRTHSCNLLDARLVQAREPLLRCIGEEARRGHLASAHRCYRSLRLLESARWWLSTLMGADQLSTVYQPSETVRQEFLCRIEALARARNPSQLERLYLETIRSYP